MELTKEWEVGFSQGVSAECQIQGHSDGDGTVLFRRVRGV